MLKADEFVDLFVRRLCLPKDVFEITLDTTFSDDLAFDSIRLMEVIGLFCEVVEMQADVDNGLISALYSFRTLFLYYCEVMSMPRDELRGKAMSGQPLVPSLIGTLVRLRAVEQRDLRVLYEFASHEDVVWRWRYTGVNPTFESFVQTFNTKAVLLQFAVVEKQSENVIGLVVAYQADLRNRFCYLAVNMAPNYMGTGLGIDAAGVFLNYVFNTWQLEKVYIEVAEYNFSYMSGLNRLFVEEGRLRSHLYLAGRRWDLIILAVYKSLFIADETHMVDDIAMDSISAGSKRSSHLSA